MPKRNADFWAKPKGLCIFIVSLNLPNYRTTLSRDVSFNVEKNGKHHLEQWKRGAEKVVERKKTEI